MGRSCSSADPPKHCYTGYGNAKAMNTRTLHSTLRALSVFTLFASLVCSINAFADAGLKGKCARKPDISELKKSVISIAQVNFMDDVVRLKDEDFSYAGVNDTKNACVYQAIISLHRIGRNKPEKYNLEVLYFPDATSRFATIKVFDWQKGKELKLY